MATTTRRPRVPFAPLNDARLQSLTSLKNRQNAITSTVLNASSKRKAASFDADVALDAENIDPSSSSSACSLVKKSKAVKGPSAFAFPPKDARVPGGSLASVKPRARIDTTCTTPRTTPFTVSALSTTTAGLPTDDAAPLSAPAGRSPTRKRSGLLNHTRRKTASPYTRIDPPSFGLPSTATTAAGALGFSISAALSATVPTTHKAPPVPVPAAKSDKASWQFAIYEDTPEELATNLMEHSTCILDISSDEESVGREQDARGKENVPPENDVSQTSHRRDAGAPRKSATRHAKLVVDHDSAIEVDRTALKEMDVKEFWPHGQEEIVIVPGDEGESSEAQEAASTFNFTAPVAADSKTLVDELMSQPGNEGDDSSTARLLQPMEKAEEGFELWESGSAKGEDAVEAVA